MNIRSQNNSRIAKAGFTLVELLVVIGLMIVIAAVVLFDFRTGDSQLTLDGIAHTIDVTIRQAQVYATSVREYTIPANGTRTFDAAYGVYVNKTSGNDDGIILFAKLPNDADSDGDTEDDDGNPEYGNKEYTGTANQCDTANNCIIREVFKANYTIADISVGTEASTSTVNTVDILFKKTGLAAMITSDGTSAEYAEIRVSSPDGKSTRVVKIWSNGITQISQ